MTGEPNRCDMSSDDELAVALHERSVTVANEITRRAHARIRDALDETELRRLAADPETYAGFIDRQVLHERRLHSPFRSLERAVDVAQAIQDQLALAERLPNPRDRRLVELVRVHALSVREISLALDRSAREVVEDLQRIWKQLREFA